MLATIVDLRYRMKEVLKAINRKEIVTVSYHNKEIATIVPIREKARMRVREHELFGMLSDSQSVPEIMDKLRGGRYRDI